MLDFLKNFWKKKGSKDLSEAPGKNTQINPNTMKQILVKALALGTGSSRGDFESPDYDLSDIKNAANADSYIKVALTKYSQLIFKAGYTINSANDQAAEYIRTRMRIMSFATSKPMEILLQEVADDLVKYSNAFLVKSRVDSMIGGIQAKGAYSNKPVGGYFRMDPATIQIKRDKNGVVKQYQQQVDSDTKTFRPEDVVHFYLDRDGGAAFGTPRIVAALEDVKLLRKIEGNIISLIYRFAIPIYQWVVGLAQTGFMATEKEIMEARTEIEKMPMDGVIVTNERTQIKAIGAEGEALDATGYLSYFEKRVFTALNMSEAMMGRGGAKQDADNMEAQVHDTVKFIQRVISIFIENQMFMELLLEGGYNPLMNEQDIVTFDFEEINLDTKVKMENHEMLKFQSNVTPFEEARQNIGLRGDNVDENRLYSNMIEKNRAIAEIQAKADAAANIAAGKQGNAAGGSNINGNGTTKSAKPNGAATQTNRPTNQHGTTSAKVKEMAEAADDNDKTAKNVDIYKKNFRTVYKKYQDTRNDILKHPESADVVLPVSKDGITREIRRYIEMSLQDGINQAFKDNNQSAPSSVEKISVAIFDNHINKTVVDLFKDIKSKIRGKEEDKAHINLVFDTLEYRLRFLSEYVVPKAFWYGYVKACASMDIAKVYVDFSGSKDEEGHDAEINTRRFSLEDIPSYHAYCDCKIRLEKVGEKE